MGSLEVFTTSGDNQWTQRWSKSGNQGDQWGNALVEMPIGLTGVRFKGITASSEYGDMALDDVRVGPWNGPLPTPSPTAAPTMARFVQAQQETNICPAGYAHIVEIGDCNLAATALNFAGDVPSVTWQDAPKGCLRDGSNVRFNKATPGQASRLMLLCQLLANSPPTEAPAATPQPTDPAAVPRGRIPDCDFEQ
jgi:hypothetical protein